MHQPFLSSRCSELPHIVLTGCMADVISSVNHITNSYVIIVIIIINNNKNKTNQPSSKQNASLWCFSQAIIKNFFAFLWKTKQRKELVMAVIRQTQFYLCFLKMVYLTFMRRELSCIKVTHVKPKTVCKKNSETGLFLNGDETWCNMGTSFNAYLRFPHIHK